MFCLFGLYDKVLVSVMMVMMTLRSWINKGAWEFSQGPRVGQHQGLIVAQGVWLLSPLWLEFHSLSLLHHI